MTTKFRFDVQLGTDVRSSVPAETDPLHVLVLADFSGSTSKERKSEAVPMAVDIDDFAVVMRRLQPTVTLELSQGPVTLTFESLDDFHPDRLFDRLDLIRELRESRERLSNRTTFAAEAARLLGGTPLASEPAGDQAEEDDEETVSRLLGKQPVAQDPSAGRSAAKNVQQLIHDIVAPHIDAGAGEDQQRLIASVDQAIGEHMRSVLHAGAFQRLEAVWRALHWLVFENAAGEALRVTVMDVDRASMIDDFNGCGGQLDKAPLYRRIVKDNRGPGAVAYSMIIADMAFDASAPDLALLGAMGLVAAHAGAPLFAAADRALYGCDALDEQPDCDTWRELEDEAQQRWQALRTSPVAQWIGLAAPRIIGRLPYGKGTDPIEPFDFTELLPNPAHEAFLWLNPAFACAQLLGQAFSEASWDMRADDVLELADLPLALYEQAGGAAIKPCAEVLLSENSAAALRNRGIMAYMSHRDRNAVRLAGFHSIASPPVSLPGAWQR